MPFEIKDLETYKGYQTKLKSEAQKIKKNGYFVMFDKYAFKEGKKPLLLILPRKNPDLEKSITNSGAKIKASGTCEESNDGLVFQVKTGTFSNKDVEHFGIPGKVAQDDEENVKNDKGKEKVDESTEDKGEPKKSTWTPATPNKGQPPKNVVGTAAKEREDQQREIEAYIKQRTDLLEFAKGYLQDMEFFLGKAKAMINLINPLVERAERGERTKELEQSLAGNLHNAKQLREAAQKTFDEKGRHIAQGRQVNADHFIKDKNVAKRVTAQYRGIFEQVTRITAQTTNLHREIISELDEAIRSLTLMQNLVTTDKADVKNLVEYLDGVLKSLAEHRENIRREAVLDNINQAITNLSKDTKSTKEDKKTIKEQSQLNVNIKREKIDTIMKQMQLLSKAAIKRIKMAEGNKEIQDRYEKLAKCYGEATKLKREFDQKEADFKRLVQDLEKQLV